MIDMLVYLLLLFPGMRIFAPVPNDLNGTIWAGDLTLLATRAPVFVVLVMGHDHLTPETIKHLKGIPVVRILLCDDLFSCVDEIFARDAHPCEQGLDSSEYV